ncbi:MAG: chromate transporter [Firmicutes bacterium]|nr:chromate transporter [Bacillota bacterium]
MISILEEELVSKKNWITTEDMLDMLVIAESTPGVIAVNTATSVGYRLRGVWGAILATLGVELPSFVIITALSFVIELVADNEWYKAAFTGIQACVTVLIVNAFWKMANQLQRDWFNVVLVIAAFGVATFTNFNAAFIIVIGGVIGVLFSWIRQTVLKKKQSETADCTEDTDNANVETEDLLLNVSDTEAKEKETSCDGEDKL